MRTSQSPQNGIHLPRCLLWRARRFVRSCGGVVTKQERQGAYSGCINLYTDDGEHCKAATLQRSTLPSALAWHPTQKWLASGWGSGDIILWNDGSKVAHDCKALHTSAVDVLEWSRDGSLLVSADGDGRIGVWKPTKTGKLVC